MHRAAQVHTQGDERLLANQVDAVPNTPTHLDKSVLDHVPSLHSQHARGSVKLCPFHRKSECGSNPCAAACASGGLLLHLATLGRRGGEDEGGKGRGRMGWEGGEDGGGEGRRREDGEDKMV